MRRDVVFMHLPKTAGTSLREALEQALQGHIILRDYGRDPATSPELSDLIYAKRKLSEFRKRFDEKDRGILLSGHFPTTLKDRSVSRGVARYWDHFNAESFVTFLRNPLDRIYSQFAHFVNLSGWTAGFEEFVTSDRGRQRCRFMSLLLSGADLDRFGFIGFMEEYDASIAALETYLGTALPRKKTNIGDYGTIAEVLENDRYRSMLLELCEDDIVLYERLRRERSGTYASVGADASVADKYIGQVVLDGSKAAGWLCNKAREFIAEVEIFCGGVRVGSAPADRYRKKPKERGHSRSGVCGFEIDLQALGAARPGAQLSFRAKGSDYELSGSPVHL